MNVRDCMSTKVRLTSPQETIQQAAQAMKEADTGALPVGDNNRLIGMITDRDIALRAVAEGRGPQTPVGEAMSGKIEYVFEDEELDQAAEKMSELKVRRLAVLNRDKRLVGILSLSDLAQRGAAHGAKALSGVSKSGGPHMQA
jgi:CBS domain-containing protein